MNNDERDTGYVILSSMEQGAETDTVYHVMRDALSRWVRRGGYIVATHELAHSSSRGYYQPATLPGRALSVDGIQAALVSEGASEDEAYLATNKAFDRRGDRRR